MGRRLSRGAFYGLATQLVDKVLPILILLYLARSLAADQFGVYAFLIAYLSFFQIACDYSIDTVLVREMSVAGCDRETLLRAGLGLKLLLGCALALAACVLVSPLSSGQVPVSLMAVAALALPSALGGAYRAYFRAEIDIRAVFLLALGRLLLLASGVVAAVVWDLGLPGIFGAVVIANLLSAAAVGLLLRDRVQPLPAFNAEAWVLLLRAAAPLLGTALAITVSLRAGQMLLMSMRGPVEVGLYGAASRIAEAFTLLPEALMIAVLPLMASLHGEDVDAARRAAARAVRYLVAPIGAAVLLCAVEGRAIMELLFGPSFAPAAPVLLVLAFTALFAAAGTVMLNLLVAAGRVKTLYRNTACFAVFNVILSWLLIGPYGELGAAVAVLAGSAASQISLAMLPRTRSYVRPLLAPALKTLVALAPALAVGYYFEFGTLAGAFASLALYLAAVAALRIVTRSDLEYLRDAVSKQSRDIE